MILHYWRSFSPWTSHTDQQEEYSMFPAWCGLPLTPPDWIIHWFITVPCHAMPDHLGTSSTSGKDVPRWWAHGSHSDIVNTSRQYPLCTLDWTYFEYVCVLDALSHFTFIYSMYVFFVYKLFTHHNCVFSSNTQLHFRLYTFWTHLWIWYTVFSRIYLFYLPMFFIIYELVNYVFKHSSPAFSMY